MGFGGVNNANGKINGVLYTDRILCMYFYVFTMCVKISWIPSRSNVLVLGVRCSFDGTIFYGMNDVSVSEVLVLFYTTQFTAYVMNLSL